VLSTLTPVIAQAQPAAPRQILDLSPLTSLALQVFGLLILGAVIVALFMGLKSMKPKALIAVACCVLIAGWIIRQAQEPEKLRESDTYDVIDDMAGIDSGGAPPATR
jgi:hypothetical protein